MWKLKKKLKAENKVKDPLRKYPPRNVKRIPLNATTNF